MKRIDSEGRDVTYLPGLWSEDDTKQHQLDFCVVAGPCYGLKVPKENGLRSIFFKDTKTGRLILHVGYSFVANSDKSELTVFVPEKMLPFDVECFLNGLRSVERMKAFDPWTGILPDPE